MAAVRINVRLPNNAITLHVPPSVYNAMVADGSWPRGTNSLVYEMGERVWYIAPDHPDFKRLTERFGPQNPKAEMQWKQELDQLDRARQALSGRRIIGPEDRLFLPGLVGHTEQARQIGALWDRSARMWYVSARHKDAAALAKKYASPSAARAAAEHDAAVTATSMDKNRGAREASGDSAPFAPAAKMPKTGRRKIAAPKGSKPSVEAPTKRATKLTLRRRRRDPGQER
jgi:hypothetical protein